MIFVRGLFVRCQNLEHHCACYRVGLGVGKVWYSGGTFLSHVYTLMIFIWEELMCGLQLGGHCVCCIVVVGEGKVWYSGGTFLSHVYTLMIFVCGLFVC